MKISIFTFHRSLNYGAFLQAFALENHLKKNNNEVEIVDINRKVYFIGNEWEKRPVIGTILNCYYNKIYQWKLKFFYNKQSIEKYFTLGKHYGSVSELIDDPPKSDVYITGSDQVWNPDLIIDPNVYDFTNVYFLNFGSEKIKRISYAASFGKKTLHDDYLRKIIPLLHRFNWISVREEDMVDVLTKQGIKCDLVCDPVLLHDKDFYLQHIKKMKNNNDNKILCYLIRVPLSASLRKVLLKAGFNIKTIELDKIKLMPSIFKWLQLIYNSSFVITDSFHCVVFCLIFNKPFLTLAAKNSFNGMNGRIESLLKFVGLNERIIYNQDDDIITIKKMINKKINWNSINEKILKFRKFSEELLSKSLEK